jgi:aminopeptidase N
MISHRGGLSGTSGKVLLLVLAIGICSPPVTPLESLHPTRATNSRARRVHDYDVQHYRIAVSFDWAAESVAGETTITLSPVKDGFREIEIDAGKMKIESVRLGAGTPLRFRYERDEKLFVELDREYAAGQELAVTIAHSAVPDRGLEFIKPTQSEPKRPHQIWSQGEAEDNHFWFPCYDYPDDKATSELIATVDKRYRVISNGALVANHENPGGTRTWHWRMDQPFSSYLISVIVGEFAEIRHEFKKTPVVSYVYRDQIRNATLSFGKLPRMMEFFSGRFGHGYPFAKYAQTTVHDFEGGMENITATTLADTAVHDARAHLNVSSDGLIAHELAHSWFGNMVTCRDWSDVWLNEGFATFFEAVWAEHDLGPSEYLYEMLGNQQAYFQTWFQGERRPLVTEKYVDPDSLFDAYSYQRGAAVLNMLRFVLGEDQFWKAVRYYITKYRWQNVNTPQLVTAIEESTGQNLQWFFDQWIYKLGHPEIEITSSYDGARSLKLRVIQTAMPQPTASGHEYPRFFTMPVDIAITTAAGERVHRVLIDKPECEFVFAVDSKPLIVNFDRGNYLIKQVRFNRSDEELAHQALHDADVMGRVRAAIQLKLRTSEVAVAAMAEAALRDRFWGVRLEAVRSLWTVKNATARAALSKAARDRDPRIRAAALEGLAEFKDPLLAGLYADTLATERSYFAVAEAAVALGQTGSPRAFGALANAVNQDSWQEIIREGALRGLIALKDPRSGDLGIRYAVPGNPAGVRRLAFQLLGEVGKGNDRALSALSDALTETPTIAVDAIQPLGRLGDLRAIRALEEFVRRDDAWPSAIQLANRVINRLKDAARQTELRE